MGRDTGLRRGSPIAAALLLLGVSSTVLADQATEVAALEANARRHARQESSPCGKRKSRSARRTAKRIRSIVKGTGATTATRRACRTVP